MSEVVKGSKELQKRSSSNRETDAVGTSTAQAVTDKAIDVSDIQSPSAIKSVKESPGNESNIPGSSPPPETSVSAPSTPAPSASNSPPASPCAKPSKTSTSPTIQSMQALQLQEHPRVSKAVETLKANSQSQGETTSKTHMKSEKSIKQSRSSDDIKDESASKGRGDERLTYADVMRKHSGKKPNSLPSSPSKSGKKVVSD
jgi:hypothetical protein